MENAPYPYSTNEWEKFVGEGDFDKIAASTAHDKHRKWISVKIEQGMAHRSGVRSKGTNRENSERSEDFQPQNH